MNSAWHGHDVPAVAALLAEDHGDAWHQVAAWHRTADLLGYHVDTLVDIRERVVAAWQPARSPAAAAYVGHLDRLIASVGDTRAAATANGAALAGILSTLEDARTRVDAVRREWEWNAATERRQAGILPPRGPNVTPQWRETLNQQVYGQMAAVDQAIFEYTNQLAVPQPYVPGGRDENQRQLAGAGATDQSIEGVTGEPSRLVDVGSHRLGPAAEVPPPGTWAPMAGDAGAPVLASGAPATVAGPAGPAQDPVRTAPSRHGNPSDAVGPSTPGHLPWPRNPGREPDVRRTAGARRAAARGAPGRGPVRPRTVPAASAPEAGSFRPAAGETPPTGPGQTPADRALPVPGHLEGQDGTRMPPTAGMLGASGILPAAAGQRSPFQRHRWKIATGVEPVIGPRRVVARVDPGPGVIGIDR